MNFYCFFLINSLQRIFLYKNLCCTSTHFLTTIQHSLIRFRSNVEWYCISFENSNKIFFPQAVCNDLKSHVLLLWVLFPFIALFLYLLLVHGCHIKFTLTRERQALRYFSPGFSATTCSKATFSVTGCDLTTPRHTRSGVSVSRGVRGGTIYSIDHYPSIFFGNTNNELPVI